MRTGERQGLIEVASGKRKAALVVRGARVFLSHTGEFLEADVAVEGGRIAGIGSYAGMEEIDGRGKYLVPGFIDGHVHIESSMLTPAEFARAVLPSGTTAVVTDPHEIANVAGLSGLRYMMKAAEGLPLDMYFTLPSCVPATDLEDAGAVLCAADLAPFLGDVRVLGLAEMMNVPGVLAGDGEVAEKLCRTLAAGKRCEGHAPALSGRALMGYRAAGITSDHECVTEEEGRERLRAGMQLQIREGSAARNLERLLPLVTERTARYCSFVTDDRHPADLLSDGSVNAMVRKAVRFGLSPELAVLCASTYTAEYYGLRDVGKIAAGCRADFLLLDDLTEWKPHMVFKDGRAVAKDGRLTAEVSPADAGELSASVRLCGVTRKAFDVFAPAGKVFAIGLVAGQIVTKKLRVDVRTEGGKAAIDRGRDLLKAAVFERHHATGTSAAAMVQGYGLKRGALASTVAHDSHNLIVLGASEEDMLFAVQAIEKMQGGMAVVADGEVLASLPLNIGGLMSTRPAEEVAEKVEELSRVAYSLGVHREYDPFLTLAFLSLPVVPEIKLTNRGLVDVLSGKFLDSV